MRVAVLLVSVAAVCACTIAPANDAPSSPSPPLMIVGGYSAADLSDANVKTAQSLAEKEIYARNPTRALVEKVRAETQVVAGRNYRFTITMSGGVSYLVTVFQPLRGEMTISAYEKLS